MSTQKCELSYYEGVDQYNTTFEHIILNFTSIHSISNLDESLRRNRFKTWYKNSRTCVCQIRVWGIPDWFMNCQEALWSFGSICKAREVSKTICAQTRNILVLRKKVRDIRDLAESISRVHDGLSTLSLAVLMCQHHELARSILCLAPFKDFENIKMSDVTVAGNPWPEPEP